MPLRVPDTNTFSLQDVHEVVSEHTPATMGNLDNCFVNSVDDFFDPLYKGSKDRLSNFRNYGMHNKQYIIELDEMILDPHSPTPTIANRADLNHSTSYYIPMKLVNPDPFYIKKLSWNIYWADAYDQQRIDFTHLYFIFSEPTNYGYLTGDVLFDNDPHNVFKNKVSIPWQTGSTYDRYTLYIDNNMTDSFYLGIRAHPYANYINTHKAISLWLEKITGGDNILLSPYPYGFNVRFISDTKFRAYYPNPVSLKAGGVLTVVGYSGYGDEFQIVTAGGDTIASADVYDYKESKVYIPFDVPAGTYILRITRPDKKPAVIGKISIAP